MFITLYQTKLNHQTVLMSMKEYNCILNSKKSGIVYDYIMDDLLKVFQENIHVVKVLIYKTPYEKRKICNFAG